MEELKRAEKNRYELFCTMIASDVDERSVVLEIGAGRGLCRHVRTIVEKSTRLIGVDPSDNILHNPYVTDAIQSRFEDSAIPDGSVDVVYSIYVMEHIEDAVGIFQKIIRILKPGGRLYFITPNRRHYFVLLSKLVDTLGVKKIWIEKVMHARVNVDFGFASFYRINDDRSIIALSRANNFSQCDISFRDSPEDITYYLPRGLKWLPFAVSSLMKISRIPARYYSDIIVKMTK